MLGYLLHCGEKNRNAGCLSFSMQSMLCAIMGVYYFQCNQRLGISSAKEGLRWRVYSGGSTVEGLRWRVYCGGSTVEGLRWRVYGGGSMLEGLRWRVYSGGSTLPNIYSVDHIHPPQVEHISAKDCIRSTCGLSCELQCSAVQYSKE